jgi:outer membrane immunogenic protein
VVWALTRRYLYLVGLAPALLLGHPASGADLETPAIQRPVPVPVFSWTTFYFGVNAGYSWSTAQSELRVGGTTFSSASDPINGAVGGLQVGFNYQLGSFVVGLEGDYQYTGQKVTRAGSLFVGVPPAIGIIPTVETDRLQPFGSVRARFGVAIDRWLVYATGGAAHLSVEARHTLPDGTVTIAGWGKWGWVAGAGVEYAPYNQVSVRLEYLYFDSGTVTLDNIWPPGAAFDWRVQSNLVRVAANFLL